MRKRQCAAVPYRIGPDGPEILLVTSRNKGRWIVPKGNVERKLGPRRSAAVEAFEEAGVVGTVLPDLLGCYRHPRARLTDVFLLDVETELAAWPEDHVRRRRWVPGPEAAGAVRVAGLRPVLEIAAAYIAHLGAERPHLPTGNSTVIVPG